MSDDMQPAWDFQRGFRFFDASTGVLQPGSMLLPNAAALAANTPPGHAPTQVTADHLTQRIDIETGEPVPFTPVHAPVVLDAPTARAERDRLLAACDWVVARAYEQGVPVPAPWATYRAALRDLPEQPGFPESITWPTPPTS